MTPKVANPNKDIYAKNLLRKGITYSQIQSKLSSIFGSGIGTNRLIEFNRNIRKEKKFLNKFVNEKMQLNNENYSEKFRLLYMKLDQEHSLIEEIFKKLEKFEEPKQNIQGISKNILKEDKNELENDLLQKDLNFTMHYMLRKEEIKDYLTKNKRDLFEISQDDLFEISQDTKIVPTLIEIILNDLKFEKNRKFSNSK